MKKRPFYFNYSLFSILAFIVLFTSCSWNKDSSENKEIIEIQLPQWPPDYGKAEKYPELAEWLIQIEGNGIHQIYRINEFNTTELFYAVKKNQPFCVTAYPITKMENENKCSFFKCAGGIYPYNFQKKNFSKGELPLTWENGFSAFVMESLICKNSGADLSQQEILNYLSYFNWKKFQKVISEKTEESVQKILEQREDTTTSLVNFYNPWQLNVYEIMENIGYRNFSVNSLKAKEIFSIPIENSLTLSAYIPENEIIEKYRQVVLKKNEDNWFSVYNSYGILFQGTSAKNVSTDYVLMPIYIEEYEK